MMRLQILLACLLSTATLLRSVQAEEVPPHRELFVDKALIESMDGLSLQLATPRDEGATLAYDKPWEGLFSAYVTIINTGEIFRAYYRGHAQHAPDGSPSEVTCVAESVDGIHWTKPELGIFEVKGTKANNVVLAEAAPVMHNFCPFLDTNPACKPDERYKAVGGTTPKGLYAYVSQDGLHWKLLQKEPVFSPKGWTLDSQNVPLWSPKENCYVLYFRQSAGKMRSVARTTSTDFINWTTPVAMKYSDTGTETPAHQLYTSQTSPYFRAPHILIATPARFMPSRRVLTDEQAVAIGVHPKYFGDTSDAMFMTSRGGDLYDVTFRQGFLRPGMGASNWVSRTNYPALNIVQTGPAEMSMYVNQDYGQPTAHLRRYSLRLDGFASAHAGADTGTLVTKPVALTGNPLTLNFSTSAAGGIQVEVQSEDGKPLPGFSLEDCTVQIGNEIERPVAWKSADFTSLKGQKVRLKFVITDADLYAITY